MIGNFMFKSWRRCLLTALLLAFFGGGLLFVEKRWSPVRGFLGAIELARLGPGDKAANTQPHSAISGRLVAHAGGGLENFSYINSIDAIEENYRRGHRVFELDLAFTKDGTLVLVHEWQNGKVLTLAEFQSALIHGRYRPTDWKMVAQFLHTHKDAFVITDTKYDNRAVLTRIADVSSNVCNQIIPQIYSFNEYSMARKLGFSSIVLTNYKKKYWGQSLVKFAATRDVSITLPWETKNLTIARLLTSNKVEVFFHTVNDDSIVKVHPEWKFYTDFLLPTAF